MICQRSPGGRLCIHAGLPKTANTMLQLHLFPRHSQLEYLGTFKRDGMKRRYDKCRDGAVQEIINQLVHRGKYRPRLARCRRLFDESIVPAFDAGRGPLWSYEALALHRPNVRRKRAENLRDVFHECNVIFTLRHPLRLVESAYFQHLRKTHVAGKGHRGRGPCYLPIDRWLKQTWGRQGKAPADHLEYAETIEIFADVFGKESIGVFLFEQLVEDHEAFIASLCRFIGIDPEQGVALTAGKREADRWTTTQVEKLEQIQASFSQSMRFRFASRRQRRIMLGLRPNGLGRPGERARAAIPDDWQRRILDQTRQGNRRLVERWGLPLEQYGYPL